MFVPPKIASAGAKKFYAFFTSFHSNDSNEDLNGSAMKSAEVKYLSYLITQTQTHAHIYI